MSKKQKLDKAIVDHNAKQSVFMNIVDYILPTTGKQKPTRSGK